MALLDDLKTFQAVYHQYIGACDDLEKRSNRYKYLNEHGVEVWYKQSDNGLIVASRQIEDSIAEASKAIAAKERQITAGQDYIAKSHRALLDEIEEREGEAAQAGPSRWPTLSVLWKYPLFGILICFLMDTIYGAVTGGEDLEMSEGLAITIYVLIGLCIAATFFVPWVRARNKANDGKREAQQRYDKAVEPIKQKSIALQEQIKISQQELNSLKPRAAQQKSVAMEQAKLLWASDMVEKGDEIQRCAAQCDQLYGQLVSLGTVPSERDWPAIDDVVDKIASGRADSLKEALLLIDTDERHRELMSVQVAQLNEHVKLRKQLKVDASNLTRQMELTRAEIQRQHTADREQRDYQHAQQMAAEAAQIALQAASYAEQRRFNNEVRKQMQ